MNNASMSVGSCLLVASLLTACGGGSSDSRPAPTPAPTYAVGGTVSGLSGSGLVLQNNAANELAVSADGDFTFDTELADGAAYSVAVSSQPTDPSQTCVVAGDSGTVADADITSVAVTCTTNSFVVGGTVTGLEAASSGVVLVNNGGDPATIAANGSFVFDTPVLSGEPYAIRVLTQPGDPEPQVCRVESGAGTVANDAVAAPTITCVTQHPRFASSLDFNDASYSSYVVDADSGQLRQIGFITTGDLPIDVARDATERVGYVLSRGDATLTAFTRDSVTGELTEAPGSPYDTGAVPNPTDAVDGGPSSITAHPRLAYVYVANGAGANDIAGFAVDATTGALSEIPGSPFAAGTRPFSLTIDATGRFAYAVNADSDDIYTYTIDQGTGALTEIAESRVATGERPGVLTLHASGRFAYVPNVDSGDISAYAVNATTGVLSPVTGSPFTAGERPAIELTLHPGGGFLYARNRGLPDTAGTVAAYAIDLSTGALAPLGASLAIEENSTGQWLDPAGRVLYFANRGPEAAAPAVRQGSISAFSIDGGSGELTPVAGSPVELTPAPYSVSVDPSGRYLYAASAFGNLAYSFHINQTTGALTELAYAGRIVTRSQPVALISFSMSATPAPATFRSDFAYVANQAAGTISGLSIDQADGGLVGVAGGSTTAGDEPRDVVVHPNGRLLLAVSGANTSAVITSYNFDPATGSLSAAVDTHEVGGTPVALAMSRDGRAAYIANGAADGHIQAVSVDGSTGVFSTINGVGSVTNLVDTTGIPTAITVAPNGRFVYYATQEGWGRARLDPASAGFTLPTSELTGSAQSRTAVAVHPDGRYLYLALASGSIERHELDPYTGGSVALVTTAAGTAPSSIAIDPTGRFLYTANSGSNNVSAFAIDASDGTLTLIDTDAPGANPIAAGTNPVSVRVDYSGRYVYVLSHDQNILRSFEIKVDGALMPAAGVALTGAEPNALAVSEVVE